MMMTSAIERAFDLARSGQCRSVSEIIRRLPPQNRQAVEAHLSEPAARRELILLCGDAWSQPTSDRRGDQSSQTNVRFGSKADTDDQKATGSSGRGAELMSAMGRKRTFQ